MYTFGQYFQSFWTILWSLFMNSTYLLPLKNQFFYLVIKVKTKATEFSRNFVQKFTFNINYKKSTTYFISGSLCDFIHPSAVEEIVGFGCNFLVNSSYHLMVKK